MRTFFILLMFQAYSVEINEFLSSCVPLKADEKIDIPLNLRRVKLDIGLSYNAPHSQYWLEREEDLFVFGFEPNPYSVNEIKKGAVKKHSVHGDPLNPKYLENHMFIVPCALGLKSGELAQFYITEDDCGCSSLYQPIFALEQIIEVPVFRLSQFFEYFPFDTHPVIDYIKIDAQGSDLDIVKGAENWLSEKVVYITLEAENNQYADTINSEQDIDSYMEQIGFQRIRTLDTCDPTYFNPRFIDYIQTNVVQIYQRG